MNGVYPVRLLGRLLLGVAVSITLLGTATPARAWADRGVRFVAAWDGFSAIVTGCDGTCPAILVIPTSVFHPGFYDDLPVREIASSAFQDRQLTRVTIPDSVTSIGSSAFANNNLTSVKIPNSVTSISAEAFAYNSLTSVTFPGYVTSIGDYAFASNALTSVTIPDSVTSIGDYAFYNNQLASVTIPDSVTSIGEQAFANNRLTIVTFEGNAPTAGFDVFLGNDGLTAVTRLIGTTGWGATWGGKPVVISPLRELDGFKYTVSDGSATVIGCSEACPTTIVIPASFDGSPVVSLSNYAFANNNLTSVTIPDSVTSIGSSAFANNNLTSVTIPDSITSIGSNAFAANQLTSVTIPNSVTSIGSGAFMLNQLTSVTIPNPVTSIGNAAFAINRLTRIVFEGNAPTAGLDVLLGNDGLAAVTRLNGTTGWGATWGGKRVVIATRATATAKPTITGTTRIGQTLTAKKGTWRGSPTPTYTYQWYVCAKAVTAARTAVPSTCTRITGATRSTFKLTAAQRNKYVAVLVTGTSLGTTATTWLSRTTAKIR